MRKILGDVTAMAVCIGVLGGALALGGTEAVAAPVGGIAQQTRSAPPGIVAVDYYWHHHHWHHRRWEHDHYRYYD